jgi:hypothetical protein
MKTILYILGGLFILSRLNGQGITLAGTATAVASPFGTTPAGGAAGIISPVGDPAAPYYGDPGGGPAPITPIATNSHNIGSTFGHLAQSSTGNFTPLNPIRTRGLFRVS